MTRLVFLTVWLAAVLWAAPAAAHAVLLQATPADRTTLADSPTAIVLQFSEPVQPLVLRVLDTAGAGIGGTVATGAHTLTFRPDAVLRAGQYLVTYRVVSDDGHPVGGTIVFAVGGTPRAWVEAPEVPEGPWRWAAAANRALWMLSIALLAGATLFPLLAPAQRGDFKSALASTAAGASAIGITTAALAILLEGGVVLGGGSLLDLWRAGFDTTQARQSLVSVLLTVVLWRAAWQRDAVYTGAVLAVALLATVALTGHVVTAARPWISVPLLLLHATPALLWVGSFVPLLAIVQAPASAADRVLPRFSALAIAGVGVLAIAGAGVAVLQVRELGALTTTAYGLGLIAKSALATLLLLLAASNRLVLTPRILAGKERARATLSGAIGLELILGAAILAATAVLAQTPPPRSLVEPAEAHEHDGTGADTGVAVGAVAQGKSALIGVSPARPGRNTITVALRGAGWVDIAPLSVTAAFSHAAAGIETIVRELARVAPGLYEYTGPELAVAGEWTVRVEVLVNDFERVTYSVPIPIQ